MKILQALFVAGIAVGSLQAQAGGIYRCTAPGGAVTSYEARARDEVLRPLSTACRRALVAACNSPLI